MVAVSVGWNELLVLALTGLAGAAAAFGRARPSPCARHLFAGVCLRGDQRSIYSLIVWRINPAWLLATGAAIGWLMR
jgi:hypothetical protein